MIYHLVRALFVSIIGVILTITLKRYVKFTLRNSLIAFIVWWVAFGVILYFPIERGVLKFETPEEAFAYSNLYQSIEHVIYGQDCAFITYQEFNSSDYQYSYVNKFKEGWLITPPRIGFVTSFQSSENFTVWFIRDDEAGQVLVHAYKVVNDKTVDISEIEIVDNRQSEFQRFTKVIKGGSSLVIYDFFTVIQLHDLEWYSITIDDVSLVYE